MATIRELVTKILFRSDATGLKKVETHATAAKRQMRAASRAAWALKRDLRGIGVGVKTMIAAVVAGRIAKTFTVDFAKSTDEAVKFSKALGLGLESYLGLTHAMRLSGGEIGDLQKSLGQLQKRALEVTQGNKKIGKSFSQLGIDVKDSEGNLRSADDLMIEMADRFKGMKNTTERTGLAMQLFGRTGQKLMPMFLEGSKGIRAMMQEAKELGIVLSKDQAKIAENYNDEMLRAKSILIGLRNIIALRVLPAITKNIRAFQIWAREGNNLRVLIDRLIVAAKLLAVVFAAVAAVKFGQTMGTIALATKRAVIWTRALGAAQAVAYAKFILIAAAIAAVVLVIQDLWVYSKGGESAVGKLLERFAPAEKIRGVLNAVGGALKRIGEAAAQLGRAAIPVVIAVLERLIPIGIKIARAWWAVQQAIATVARTLWKEFGPALTDLGVALVELFEELWPVVIDGAREAWAAAQTLGAELLSVWRSVWPQLKEMAASAYELMQAGVAALKVAWAELKPTVAAIGEALSELWITAKPIIVEILKGSLYMSKLFANLAKDALPHLGKAFRIVFKGIATVITGSIKQLTFMVRMVTKIVSGLKTAYSMAMAVLGLKDAGTALGAGSAAIGGVAPGLATALDPGAVLRRAQALQQTNSFTIGSVPITINGSDLGPEELETATKKALQGAINDTFSSFKPVFG